MQRAYDVEVTRLGKSAPPSLQGHWYWSIGEQSSVGPLGMFIIRIESGRTYWRRGKPRRGKGRYFPTASAALNDGRRWLAENADTLETNKNTIAY